MTIFEGMCIGFLAGVVGTLICVMGGFLMDRKGPKDEIQDTEGKQ